MTTPTGSTPGAGHEADGRSELWGGADDCGDQAAFGGAGAARSRGHGWRIGETRADPDECEAGKNVREVGAVGGDETEECCARRDQKHRGDHDGAVPVAGREHGRLAGGQENRESHGSEPEADLERGQREGALEVDRDEKDDGG